MKSKMISLMVGLMLVSLVIAGCATTTTTNPDGSITESHSLDVVQATILLNFALETFRTVSAEIDAYRGEEELSEPDEMDLARLELRRLAIARGMELLQEFLDSGGLGTLEVPGDLIGDLTPTGS